ncbi:Putative serine/threonine-protein kinase/receptor [Monoraphidium neglectum]|uniref:Putative serine/threonine-protein kinase/receptor n=1 Tax=Monoraphidium neglectum TaxID=145388 RepID=A0A0D2J9F1_9CHLO|nr:Putative serine/threonine-protein kinase/receptor [Monoraphidium neglectum]KIY96377.1 Putative serine/threonine-protein kinase/receptor [Monoraphidium neglectum]|eukprot:XP_013895397.1 Putative serine/threonine-protein kinase/receptor [Monoraphidium neglectum]
MGFDFENVVKAHHFVTWGAAGVSRPEGNGVADARHISFNGSFTVPFFDVASSSGGNSLVASGNGSGGTSAAAASKRMVETWILQEYCDGGTLQDAVFEKGSGAFFNTQMVPQMGVMLHMLLGVARGMEWLHARNVLHGDLKAANVLLKSPDGGRGAAASFSGSHSGAASQRLGGGPGAAEAARAAVAESVMAMVPKVADFGLSRIMGEGATHLSTHTLGTITHQCPELIRTGRLSKPADAFSFGVVMWEVIMAANPWGGKMMGEIVTAVMEGRRLTFGPAAPQAYVELAKDCMRGVSERRPTFDQIVARLQAMLGQQDELQAEAEAGAANAAAAAAAQETPVAEDGWRRVA